jgi:hypothetical protein
MGATHDRCVRLFLYLDCVRTAKRMTAHVLPFSFVRVGLVAPVRAQDKLSSGLVGFWFHLCPNLHQSREGYLTLSSCGECAP